MVGPAGEARQPSAKFPFHVHVRPVGGRVRHVQVDVVNLDLPEPAKDDLRHRPQPGGDLTLAIPELVAEVMPGRFERRARSPEVVRELVRASGRAGFDVEYSASPAADTGGATSPARAPSKSPTWLSAFRGKMRDHVRTRPPRQQARPPHVVVAQCPDRGEQPPVRGRARLDLLARPHHASIA